MCLLSQKIERFGDDYFCATGLRPNGFICPITLEDVSVDQLCRGHILNKGIRVASRKWVPQFVLLDNFYGESVESELVAYLNFSSLSAVERVERYRRFTINLNGETFKVFPAGPSAERRFPKVAFKNSDGEVFAERYVKSAQIEPGCHSDVPCEFTLEVNSLGITAGLLKSAYLTLFRMVGYRFGLEPVGSTVRKALEQFYLQRDHSATARNYFANFRGAVIVSLAGALDMIPDTLEGGTLLLHYAERRAPNGIVFAVSTLFRVNGCTLVVTLPTNSHYGHCFTSLDYYRRLLSNRAMKHWTHIARFSGNCFMVEDAPLNLDHSRTIVN